MDQVLLKIADASKLTGVSRTALYAALKRGDIKAKKHGRRTLLEASTLKAWLDDLPSYSPQRSSTDGKP